MNTNLHGGFQICISGPLKPQKHFRPRITLGIRKSSKRKQRLYEKFLKTRNAKSEAEYKVYRNMFEIIKRKSKKQTNKSPGYHEISANVIINCFSELNDPLKYLFEKSIEKGVFPDALKIARVTPLFKGGDPSNISNYRPISVLPCFSKILERIMYNRLYKYLTTEKLLYSKQFGFQTTLSTEHGIVKLVDQI